MARVRAMPVDTWVTVPNRTSRYTHALRLGDLIFSLNLDIEVSQDMYVISLRPDVWLLLSYECSIGFLDINKPD